MHAIYETEDIILNALLQAGFNIINVHNPENVENDSKNKIEEKKKRLKLLNHLDVM